MSRIDYEVLAAAAAALAASAAALFTALRQGRLSRYLTVLPPANVERKELPEAQVNDLRRRTGG